MIKIKLLNAMDTHKHRSQENLSIKKSFFLITCKLLIRKKLVNNRKKTKTLINLDKLYQKKRLKNKNIWLNSLKMLKEKLDENKNNSNLCFKGKQAYVNTIICRI